MISVSGNFPKTAKRFKNIHIDVIEMQSYSGYRYCLTAIGLDSRLPKAFLMANMEAKTVAQAL